MVMAISTAALWWWLRPPIEPQYRTALLERGSLTATVAASGQVMPVTQVTVGSQVSGQIRELFVDFNSEVKAGQLIAQIDPQLIEFQVRQAQADLEAARSQVLIAQANVQAGQASVSKAQVDVAQAERDLARQQDLVSKGFIAASEADRAQSLVNTSTQLLRGAQAQAKVVAAQVQAAQATVLQREAALAQAQTNLSRTKITSPVDGIVIKRAVERGQTVAASLQAPELFVIAQNLRDMRVEVSVDESDVGRIQPGQKASFTVDAFPGQTFEGIVDQVRKSPVNANNVVTYVAAVNFANTSGRLLPGMTANVRMVTDTREGVLKVPNAALRVRLPDLVDPKSIAKKQENTSDRGKKMPQNGSDTNARRHSTASADNSRPAMLQKIIEAVAPTEDQIRRITEIWDANRAHFAALRDMPEDQRASARKRLMADIRARINAELTPEQQTQFAQMQADTVANAGGTKGRIWVLAADGKNPQPVEVRLGLTDGSTTELLSVAPDGPALQEGALIVTGTVLTDDSTGAKGVKGASSANPRLPF